MLITTTITSSICTLVMCIQPTFSSIAHHHHHPHHHHHLAPWVNAFGHHFHPELTINIITISIHTMGK
jgi:hypothetical protein